jgi:hypothetical protein
MTTIDVHAHSPLTLRRRRTAKLATLEPTVWNAFAREFWEKQAGCMPGVRSDSLIPPELFFTTLVSAANRYRAGIGCDDVCFWIDGIKMADFGDRLPKACDVSVPGWISRVDQELAGADFTLLVANPHLVSNAVWDISRMFLRGLFAEVGVPCGGADSTFFVGRYRRTPFGVHRGQMSVMTFPVLGEKRFRIWPRGYGEAHPDIDQRVDYPEHLAASRELVGGPQDILYWPADVWHIAEGGPAFTSTFNVGFWWDRPPLTRVLFEISRQLVDAFQIAPDAQVAFPMFERTEGLLNDYLLRGVGEALSTIRAVTARDDVQAVLALDSMRMLSADGFRDIPELAPRGRIGVQRGDIVRRRRLSRILFAAGAAGSLYVAADGHIEKIEDTAAVRGVLRSLQRGEAVSVSSDVEDLLNWLSEGRCLMNGRGRS